MQHPYLRFDQDTSLPILTEDTRHSVGLLKNVVGFRTYLLDDLSGTFAQKWADDPLCFSAATTSYLRTTEELEATVDRIGFFAASNGTCRADWPLSWAAAKKEGRNQMLT